MTIQKYDQWGRRISGDQEATFAYWPDHLAALAEKDKEIHEKYKVELIAQNDQLDRYEEQIAALQEEINNPKKTYCAWCGFTVLIDDEASSGIARHIDICKSHPLNRKITALTARIKELTEALENTLLCSDAPSCHRIAKAALGGKE
jgi:predicted RNase H-like nuclease (RuvC/YqgF family)